MNRKLLIVHCSTLSASETFIRAHIDYLPFQISFVHQLPPKLVNISSYTPGAGHAVDALEEHTEEYEAIIETCSPGLILAEYGPSAVAVLKACKLKGVPLVAHFHGFDVSMTTVLERYSAGYKAVFEYASALIAVSFAMKERLISLGAPPEKINVVSYGVNLENFSVSSYPEQSSFLFLGRLVEKKAPLILLEAFKEATRRHPHLTLNIAGDGPLLEDCKRFVDRNSLGAQVHLLGAVPHHSVPQLLRETSALILPSIRSPSGDEEGLPNCILESMASGRPVISTRHSGIPEAVIDGETGILVDEGNVDALTKAIDLMASNLAQAKSMGITGRKRAEQIFDQKASISNLAKVLKEQIHQL
ncbi:MAG: glycosyltransferase [Bdellovibrionales bacterium]|nr:glycosyltransferase [Bdellovibrionales bacterium]